VIVVGADERADRDDPVAAGPILHHDRLAPTRAQPIPYQSRTDVHAGSGPERQQEFHGALRPSLRHRGRRPQRERREQA
jgi:hypothetical protein